MRGVVAVAFAMLVSLGMSGCFVAEEDPETQAADAAGSISGGTTSATRPATGSATSTGTAAAGSTAANRAPTADLSGTPLNGTAPLNVTFSINGTDADADDLTWTLTAGTTLLANGTTLPAEFTQTFGANATVVLVVSDGTLNATANVTVVITAAEAAEPPAAAGPNICEAASETSIGGGMYVDRTSWIFLESNDLPGLQYTSEPSLIGEVDSAGVGCENGDTLLF